MLDFNPSTLHNDFALLHLTEEVDLSDTSKVNTICLPSARTALDYDPNQCFATGWGKDSTGTVRIPRRATGANFLKLVLKYWAWRLTF